MTLGFRKGRANHKSFSCHQQNYTSFKSIDVKHGIEFLICRARESMVTRYWPHLCRGFNIQMADGLRQVQRQNSKPKNWHLTPESKSIQHTTAPAFASGAARTAGT